MNNITNTTLKIIEPEPSMSLTTAILATLLIICIVLGSYVYFNFHSIFKQKISRALAPWSCINCKFFESNQQEGETRKEWPPELKQYALDKLVVDNIKTKKREGVK